MGTAGDVETLQQVRRFATCNWSSKLQFSGAWPEVGEGFDGAPSAMQGADRRSCVYIAILPVTGSWSKTRQNSRMSAGVPSETRTYLLMVGMSGPIRTLFFLRCSTT